jgi:hypothetical protein
MVRLIRQLRDVASGEKGGACIVVDKVRPLKLEVFEETGVARGDCGEILAREDDSIRIVKRLRSAFYGGEKL